MTSTPRKVVRAVVLLSGGLDSATLLALAKSESRELLALTFDYGQRHRVELEAAGRVADRTGVHELKRFELDLKQFGGSALTSSMEVPKESDVIGVGIPVTYVPARNMIFLSIAVAFAEVRDAEEIWIGVNTVDFSGYPDCRPDFIAAFQRVVETGTRSGSETGIPRLVTPLIDLSKREIIELGVRLGVDYSITHSCYDPDEEGRACRRCDACVLRRHGFEAAGVADPTKYAPEGV
ncbi:MAG TPA: 7-cyano-7-deazaguanine synthase QueC [Thermoanaerobaculia bacterium]|nr:7-cyano-7-deazaguanine synthase QueC [Thermoanaerobaculia bacterium]